ncbi:uncharacterized protein LOC119689634 isoform X2 [Teleopsis dalmanni]|uniref:uncharacterized protein LOC119689634 isoform X2 n=1 Tax=Teleopsis dalmanni TaxID=139649 RepID=UPI0018CDBF26|nr:uncharacterized protein LOC119689634 isoform X2 [Teleopsis dalmanni]
MSTRGSGRLTKEISIYNYPEHLNPFYKDDQHWRLRSWALKKLGLAPKSGSSDTRLTGKRSSTLGINKTSESPPESPRRDVEETKIESFRSTNTDTNSRSMSGGAEDITPKDWLGLQHDKSLVGTKSSTSMQVRKRSLGRKSTNPFESDDEATSQEICASSSDISPLIMNRSNTGQLTDSKFDMNPVAENSRIPKILLQQLRSVNVNHGNDSGIVMKKASDCSQFYEKENMLCTNLMEAERNGVGGDIAAGVVPKKSGKCDCDILSNSVAMKTDENNISVKKGVTVKELSFLAKIRRTFTRSHYQKSKSISQTVNTESKIEENPHFEVQFEDADSAQEVIEASESNSGRGLKTVDILEKAANIIKISNRIKRMNSKFKNVGTEDLNKLRIVEDGEEDLLNNLRIVEDEGEDLLNARFKEQQTFDKLVAKHDAVSKHPNNLRIVEDIEKDLTNKAGSRMIREQQLLNSLSSIYRPGTEHLIQLRIVEPGEEKLLNAADFRFKEQQPLNKLATIHRPGVRPLLFGRLKPVKVPEIFNDTIAENKVDNDFNENNKSICLLTNHISGINSSLYGQVKTINAFIPKINEFVTTESKGAKIFDEIKESNRLLDFAKQRKSIKNYDGMTYKQIEEKVCKIGEKRKRYFDFVSDQCNLGLSKRFKSCEGNVQSHNEDFLNTCSATISRQKSILNGFKYKGRNITGQITPLVKDRCLCLHSEATPNRNSTKPNKKLNKDIYVNDKLTHDYYNILRITEEGDLVDSGYGGSPSFGSNVVRMQSVDGGGSDEKERQISGFKRFNFDTIDLSKKNWQFSTLTTFQKSSAHLNMVQAKDKYFKSPVKGQNKQDMETEVDKMTKICSSDSKKL